MMEKELILLSEYCENSCAEFDFILRLESEGLIETESFDNLKYIDQSQLSDLEVFTRLYYDLSINIEGIDVINNLLSSMRHMQQELSVLKRRLSMDIDSENDVMDDYF